MGTPVVTYIIIAFTSLVSFISFNNTANINKLIFYPYEMKETKEWFRFISHGLIHADFTHLLFNMLTLYFFGQYCELLLFSKSMYVIFYVSALVAASIPDYFKNQNNPSYRSLGASGAVAAVLASVVLLAPWQTLRIQYIIPIPAIVYLVIYIGYSAYMDRKGNDNIGHGAHLWGTLYGIAFTLIAKPGLFQYFIEQLQHPQFNFR
ncbi:MAG: rhomboid family intramembrane serine protease [Bacteroidetes bacterium]|nr:rhomboid family intramembrane serine protease [Bacteroidota bacterium]